MTHELLHDPLAEIGELQQRVNARLGPDDLSCVNINVALEQIPYRTVRTAIRKQISSGKAHYQEEHLLEEMMMLSGSCKSVGEKAGIQISETACASQGMQISDPSSIRKLVTPGICTSSIPSPLRWIIFCLVLYYHGMPLSVLGSWFGVSKTTILRRMLGLVMVLCNSAVAYCV